MADRYDLPKWSRFTACKGYPLSVVLYTLYFKQMILKANCISRPERISSPTDRSMALGNPLLAVLMQILTPEVEITPHTPRVQLLARALLPISGVYILGVVKLLQDTVI